MCQEGSGKLSSFFFYEILTKIKSIIADVIE